MHMYAMQSLYLCLWRLLPHHTFVVSALLCSLICLLRPLPNHTFVVSVVAHN